MSLIYKITGEFSMMDFIIQETDTLHKKRLNTIPYFTILGQITSIYRRRTYTGKYRIVFRCFSGSENSLYSRISTIAQKRGIEIRSRYRDVRIIESPSRLNGRKSNAGECIFDYMALCIECRFNKNSLLRCYFLEILPAGVITK